MHFRNGFDRIFGTLPCDIVCLLRDIALLAVYPCTGIYKLQKHPRPGGGMLLCCPECRSKQVAQLVPVGKKPQRTKRCYKDS